MDFYSALQPASGRDYAVLQSLAQIKPQKYETAACQASHTIHIQAEDSLKGHIDRYDALLKQHTTLREQHENLKKGFVSLSETVEVLGNQSSQTTRVAQQAQDSKLELLNRHSKVESRLEEQLQLAQDAKLDLINRHAKLQEQLDQTQKSNTDLTRRNSSLQGQLQAMTETVNALNLSCKASQDKLLLQTQVHFPQNTDVVSDLRSQLKGMKETVEALNLTCKAAEDKLLLQSQLHSDKLRLLEVTHNTLQERCKTISASAEQHRVANILLEERQKSMTKDVEILANGHVNDASKDREINNLKSLVTSRDRDISHLQSLVKTKDVDISNLQSLVSTKDMSNSLLKSQMSARDTDIKALQKSLETRPEVSVKISQEYSDRMHDKEREISSLRFKIDGHESDLRKITAECSDRLQNKEKEISSLSSKLNLQVIESKRIQNKLATAQSILKSHPIDPCLNTKTKNIIRSSAEILELAYDTGSAESMQQCLGQVGDSLLDLNEQLDTHHRISDIWLEQVKSSGI
jgi:hypothetical protein